MTDARKRAAATVLAYNGYRRGERRRTGAVSVAARQAGVRRDTIYEWLDDPAFVEALEEVKSELLTEAIQNIRAIARNKNLTANIYLAKILDPERMDDQFVREQAKRQHELDLLTRRVSELETKTAHIPQPVYQELPPVERAIAFEDLN